MKYVTITAKHHDGFALWDSQVSDYDLGNYTNPKRDIINEMAVACKKHGIKLCLYYSHWVDWEHKFGWDHTREIYGITSEEYDVYWQEKVIPQIRELLTNYGEISMMWFDMWIHHSKTIVSKQQLLQLKSLIRELQPNCLVNSRLGLSIEEDPDIDYKTLGDNQLGSKKEDFPWQSPATVAHSWGFHSSDTQWKSTSTLLQSLIGNVSLNGNFMLNIGPRANGEVPFEISQRMLEMGEWLKINGEAVYGAEAFDLDKDLHDWGKITCKQDQDKFILFLNVYNWPLNKKLFLTGPTKTPEQIYMLSNKLKSPLNFIQQGAFTEIQIPANQPDKYVSVIAVEYSEKPEILDGLVAKSVDGGYSLTPENQIQGLKSYSITPKQQNGTVPKHIIINEPGLMKWKVFFDSPGEKTMDISYASLNEKNSGKINIKIAGKFFIHEIKPTGLTVGEPNRDWHIHNFISHRVSKIQIEKPGYYDVEMEFQPATEDDLKFQWLWIN